MKLPHITHDPCAFNPMFEWSASDRDYIPRLPWWDSAAMRDREAWLRDDHWRISAGDAIDALVAALVEAAWWNHGCGLARLTAEQGDDGGEAVTVENLRKIGAE